MHDRDLGSTVQRVVRHDADGAAAILVQMHMHAWISPLWCAMQMCRGAFQDQL